MSKDATVKVALGPAKNKWEKSLLCTLKKHDASKDRRINISWEGIGETGKKGTVSKAVHMPMGASASFWVTCPPEVTVKVDSPAASFRSDAGFENEEVSFLWMK